jgi:CheY-like chemotaxis protein
MPEMNGQELYERILENRPGLHVLYISGYSHKIVAHRGNLEERVSFLQKPFTSEEFMKRADAILAFDG